jgi:hypothetical protein
MWMGTGAHPGYGVPPLCNGEAAEGGNCLRLDVLARKSGSCESGTG